MSNNSCNHRLIRRTAKIKSKPKKVQRRHEAIYMASFKMQIQSREPSIATRPSESKSNKQPSQMECWPSSTLVTLMTRKEDPQDQLHWAACFCNPPRMKFWNLRPHITQSQAIAKAMNIRNGQESVQALMALRTTGIQKKTDTRKSQNPVRNWSWNFWWLFKEPEGLHD